MCQLDKRGLLCVDKRRGLPLHGAVGPWGSSAPQLKSCSLLYSIRMTCTVLWSDYCISKIYMSAHNRDMMPHIVVL